MRSGPSTADAVRVLYVTATERDVDDVAAVLERPDESITVIAESRVEAAVARLEREAVHCLVAGADLPEQDARALLDAARVDNPGRPFVLLADTDAPATREAALRAGVTDYVPLGELADPTTGIAARIRRAIESTHTHGERRDRERWFKRLLEQSSDATFVVDPNGTFQYVTPSVEQVLGYEPTALLGADGFAGMHPSDVGEAMTAFVDLVENPDRTPTIEFRYRHADGSWVWFEARGRNLLHDALIEGIVVYVRDISERVERERALEQLSEAATELMQATTPGDIHDLAISAADDALGLPGVAVYEYDADRHALEPTAYTRNVVDLFGPPPVFPAGESIAWTAFTDQETVRTADASSHEDAFETDAPFRGAVLVPLGDHGVFVAASTTRAAFSDTDVDLVQILAANVTAALDTVEREAAIQERDRRLARQNDDLRQLERLNSIVRDTLRTVVSAATRSEIEQSVCDRFVASDSYRAAWIGAYDPVTDTVDPTAWTGVEGAFFSDPGEASSLHALDREVARTAIETGAVESRANLLDATRTPGERTDVLAYGFQSVVAVPLRDADSVLGVFVVYTADTDPVTDREAAILTETGALLGHAIRERRRTQSLLANQTVALELGISDRRFLPTQLAAEAGGTATVNGVLPHGASLGVFLTLEDGDADHVLDAADAWPSVASISSVSGDGDRRLVRVETADTRFADLVRHYGGSVRSLTATGDGARVTLEFPAGLDVRSFVDAFEDVYGGVELLARHDQADDRTPHSRESGLLGSLTDRQCEAYQSAHFSGYFDPQRRTQGGALADLMDVSAPTFHAHLRAAHRKLAAALFDDTGGLNG